MATSTSLRRGMSDQTRFLLDKVTARRILEGLLKLAETREPHCGKRWWHSLFMSAPTGEAYSVA